MTDPLVAAALDDELRDAFDTDYTFTTQHSPLPPEMRPQWRLPVLLLLLRRCWGHRATWRQLSVLNWAVRNRSSQQALLDVLDGRLAPDAALVRFEPGLGRAVDLARGAGLLAWEAGRTVKLTAAGEQAADEVERSGALATERDFLERIGRSLTQKLVDDLIGDASR